LLCEMTVFRKIIPGAFENVVIKAVALINMDP
jgi:hypothetical protein